jgi:flagellar biosynthesis protein FlhF
MRLRSFSATSAAEALRMAKEELGPDVVILATEQVGRAVKLTVGVDHQAILSHWKSESVSDAENPLDAIAHALDFHRVPGPLAERLLSSAENFLLDSPHQALGGALRTRFPVMPLTERLPERPVMLVGLPGAGKTSTLAKLAACARSKDWPVTAITCDLLKAGAVEQLATYSKALQIQAYRARTALALQRAVERSKDQLEASEPGSHEGNGMILIDTVGSNPLIAGDLEQLRELANAVDAEMVVVHAAGSDIAEAAELAALYSEIGATRLISTRLDTARRYGGILAAADAGKLAFAEMGVAPGIGDGLQVVGADALARLLLPESVVRSSAPAAAKLIGR